MGPGVGPLVRPLQVGNVFDHSALTKVRSFVQPLVAVTRLCVHVCACEGSHVLNTVNTVNGKTPNLECGRGIILTHHTSHYHTFTGSHPHTLCIIIHTFAHHTPPLTLRTLCHPITHTTSSHITHIHTLPLTTHYWKNMYMIFW